MRIKLGVDEPSVRGQRKKFGSESESTPDPAKILT